MGDTENSDVWKQKDSTVRHQWLTLAILATQERSEGSWFQDSRDKKGKTQSQKYPTQKRAGRVAPVVVHPSKHEALSSNPSAKIHN
jgi:hypothetical protein